MLDPQFVLDDAARERLVSRFGDDVREWCAALPGLVDRCCSRWHLQLEQAQSGSTSRVYFGQQHARREVVLKLTPDPCIARDEAVALRAWAASPHAVTLLGADPDAGALLLERLRPGTMLRDADVLPAARQVSGLLTGLRATTEDLSGQLPTLSQRIDFIFALIRGRLTGPRVAPLVSPELVTRSHKLARDLARPGAAVSLGLVHGDLHPANILIAPAPRHLVAIDPRPCWGDPAFDAVDWILVHFNAGQVTAGQLGQRIADLCALVPGLDVSRLWSWCRASAVIAAVQRLHHRSADQTIAGLLELAATC